MTKTKVKLFIVIISLAIIITTFLIIKNSIKSDSSKTKTRSVFIVKEEIVENIIEISGNIQAAKSQSLQAAGNGSVVAVYGKTGDFVKKGQVLVELDTSEQEYELAKLQYEIAQVKINGSPKELELKRLQLKSLQNKLEDRKIIASFSGLLADFDVAVEDYLEAKDIVGTLIERSYLKASVEVVETDAPKLAAGQKVLCTFPAYPDKVIEGYVVSYPSVGTLTSRGAAIVEVEIRIDNPPEAILPNYSFTGEIEISPKETLLLVEKQAIGFEEGKTLERPFVGISMLDATESYYLWQNGITLPNGVDSGVVILEVVSGSPASKSGLQKGDVITKVDGNDVESLAEFRYELYKHTPGDIIKITYMRGNVEKNAEITLSKNS